MKLDLFGYRFAVEQETFTWHTEKKPYKRSLVFTIERRSGPQYDHELEVREMHRQEALRKKEEEEKKAQPIPVKREKCLYKEKRMFTREEAAAERDAIMGANKQTFIRIYCCEFCNMWHLTHHRLKIH